MKRWGTMVLAVAALALSFAPVASAESDGIFDAARIGCGGCHTAAVIDLPQSPTLVKLFVDGTPAELFAGFAPETTYELTVWVIGPVVPFAGFNLEATAGVLEKVEGDGTVQTILHSECQRMERTMAPPLCNASDPSSSPRCQIENDPGCDVFDLANPDCKVCKSQDVGTSACRLCDDVEIVDIEATHTLERVILPTFTVLWTSPGDGTSEVTFYLAGNSVEGANGPTLDFWNFSDPYPIVLPAAGY